MRRLSLLALASVFVLTGCVSREQADKHLENGCAAAAEVFMEEGHKIKEVKDRIFRDEPNLGKGYREARLVIVDSDGWYDAEKEIRCIFVESFNFLSHSASIYQLKMDDKTWGKEGNEILGSMEEHMKLEKAVDQGLMKP
jgi:hypothetical protein